VEVANVPGFVVQGLGEGASAEPLLYYKYTWEINNLFEEEVKLNSTSGLIYARDATTPSFSFEKGEVQGASMKYKFAKGITWEDVKLSWYDTDGLWKTLKKWRDRIWAAKTGLGFPNEYKKRSSLTSFIYDESFGMRWRLINSWPVSVKTGELTYTDSDIKVVDVAISYDWAEEEESPAG
jgi:hypothetical protein